MCIFNIFIYFGQKIFAKKKSTIPNHGIILSESFISTFSKYFQSPKSVCRFCNEISYQLSVDHPALKRKMTRQMSPAPITITRDHTTHGALTLISAAHSPRVVNPDLNTFFNCSVFLFKSQKSLTLHSLSI